MSYNLKEKSPLIIYGIINLIAIVCVNFISDLPVRVGNWESKATLLAAFQKPEDNFYPPGGAILLIPFLSFKPDFKIAIFFYFTISAIIYYMICSRLISNRLFFYLALSALTFNPYLLWVINSSPDSVFELFLLLSGFALLLSRKYFMACLPLYLLCLTRPQYWPSFLMLPIIAKYLKLKFSNVSDVSNKFIVTPFVLLLLTLSLNQIVFKSPAIAGEAGMTAHFGHNKYWYLSMPKFDSDVFLSTGGNMDTPKVLSHSDKFSQIKDDEFRAALINIYENPKSLFLNTLQKVDSYFFAVQKNPQLSGQYFLSTDKKSIILGPNRDSWALIFGSWLYFFHRSILLIFAIASLTLIVVFATIRRDVLAQPIILFCLPYVFGSVAAILYSTETRLKIVSELLLVPFIVYIFDLFKFKRKEGKLFYQ